ncbi:MAG: hypothetical protein IPK68_01285 [Bdellovibrionales bacterium]|nr:hypothetical protein [Bdellovibrionales bacterium]
MIPKSFGIFRCKPGFTNETIEDSRQSGRGLYSLREIAVIRPLAGIRTTVVRLILVVGQQALGGSVVSKTQGADWSLEQQLSRPVQDS